MKKYLLMALVAFVIIAGAFMIQKPASKKGESYVNYFISKVEDGNEKVIDILGEAITFVGLDKDIQKGLKNFSNDISKGLSKYTTEEANTIFGIYQFTLDTIFDNIKFDLKIEEKYNEVKDSVNKVETFLTEQYKKVDEAIIKTETEVNELINGIINQ